MTLGARRPPPRVDQGDERNQSAEDDDGDCGAGRLVDWCAIQLFSDKKSIAVALLDTYAGQIEEHWRPLFDEIVSLSAEHFSERFIDRFLDFVAGHPAYLQLLAAPIRLRRSAAAKRVFRASLIKALSLRVPSLSQQKSELCANVVLQIVRGMMQCTTTQNFPRGRL